MITKRTVLVLGAGASAPYGYPLGSGLKDRILRNLHNPSTPYFDQIRRLCELQENSNRDAYFADNVSSFAAHFRNSDKNSIDRFLLHNPEYAAVGKAAIAQVLLACEEPRALVQADGDHWYRHLAEQMDDSFDNLRNNRLSVITFNYDRSLEEYLHQTWTHTHPKRAKEVPELVTSFKILHVHGHLGNLSWQSEAPHRRSYRTEFNETQLLRASLQIRTMHEAKDEAIFREAVDILRVAERIVFLGFAYDPTNLRNIGATFSGVDGREVVGTAVGISPRRQMHIRQAFVNDLRFGEDEHRCLQFLEHSVILD